MLTLPLILDGFMIMIKKIIKGKTYLDVQKTLFIDDNWLLILNFQKLFALKTIIIRLRILVY
jgi:hypothetical protein